MYIKFTYREVVNHSSGALEIESTAQAVFSKLMQLQSLAAAPHGQAIKPDEYIVTPGNIGHYYTVDVFVRDQDTAEMIVTLHTEFLPVGEMA